MDLTTIIGISGGLILVLLSVFVRGGLIALLAFISIPSIMITFGGTFAAVLVNYPFEQVVSAFRVVRKVFTESQIHPETYISEFRHLIIKASKQGILYLEEDAKKMHDEFLRRGVKMVIDGMSQELIREELETELIFTQERHKIGQEIFIALGTYSPAFGMIGTIMGLIIMLSNLQDQTQIAQGMAVALLTTFYGALAAYMIFLPIAGKLKRRSEEELFIKNVIIQGVLSLQSGEIPTVAVAKLRAYLPRSAVLEKYKRPGASSISKEKDAAAKSGKETHRRVRTKKVKVKSTRPKR